MFLIGFMASGKSAVGRSLARLLGLPFVDTDREIERAARRTIPQIFAAKGESRFRTLESRAITAAARLPPAVIAVGGGAVLSRANVDRMRRAGTVVHLDVPLFRLWARARRAGLDRRPLLAAESEEKSFEKMEGLLKARLPLYRRAAHVRVRGDAPAERVAARLARRLRGSA